MDSTFKPKRTGMVTVLERYPCGSHTGGRNSVFYLCKCDCGKEFVVSGDELSKHPYSCGCTPKPAKGEGRPNDWALGYDKETHTMACMIKPTRHVYQKSSSGVSGVFWEKDRNKWRAQICFAQHKHFLGYFDNKEDAIKARIEAEKKYYDPALHSLEGKPAQEK